MQVLNSSTLPKISSGSFASTGVNNYGGILIIKEDSIPFSPNSLLINGSKFSNDSFDEKTICDNNYYASSKNVSIYKKHSIIISEVTKGSVTASKNLEYCDETITLTAVPNAGYRLKSVKVNDVEKLPLTNNKLSLTNIKENKIITVVVEKIEYEVIDGNNQKHTIGKESGAIFRIDADKSLFSKKMMKN